jgi:hypothetical protein
MSISSNAAALARKLDMHARNVERATQSGVRESAKYAVQQEKAITTKNKKTGALARSMTWVSTGKYSATVNPILANHGKWLDKGRGPVVAKHKTKSGKPGFLKFIGKDGSTVFAHSVGPAKAQPFIEPTKQSLRVMYPKIMAAEIKKALK